MLFGDLAIEMGLMTRDDVMRLLMIQADRKRPIAEILVGQGGLTDEQLEAEMAAYRQAQVRTKRMMTTKKFVTKRLCQDVPRAVAETVTAV